MNEQQKQLALQILRRFEQANPMTRQADNAAVDMAALLQELIAEQPASVPDGWKLVPVEPTPEMQKAGAGVPLNKAARHNVIYREMLAAAPEHDQSEQHLEMVRDAERYRWLKCERFDKPYAVTNENMTAVYEGDELDSVIDAARAAEKGGQP